MNGVSGLLENVLLRAELVHETKYEQKMLRKIAKELALDRQKNRNRAWFKNVQVSTPIIESSMFILSYINAWKGVCSPKKIYMFLQ